MSRKKRWLTICEVIDGIQEDDMIPKHVGKYLTLIGHAPHIGYRSWLFRYKNVYVVLHDLGNGHFAFYMPANRLDVLIVRLRDNKLKDWLSRKRNKRK